MKIFQPLFSDGEADLLGSFIVIANTKEEAEKNAMVWYTNLEEGLQKYFAPLTGETIAIVSMIELKPNSLGVLIPALF